MNQSLLSSLQRTNSSESKWISDRPTVVRGDKLKLKNVTQVQHSQVQHESFLHV